MINDGSLIILKDAPQMPVSSTQLRSALENLSYASPSTLGLIHESIPPRVLEYIEKNNIYKLRSNYNESDLTSVIQSSPLGVGG